MRRSYSTELTHPTSAEVIRIGDMIPPYVMTTIDLRITASEQEKYLSSCRTPVRNLLGGATRETWQVGVE